VKRSSRSRREAAHGAERRRRLVGGIKGRPRDVGGRSRTDERFATPRRTAGRGGELSLALPSTPAPNALRARAKGRAVFMHAFAWRAASVRAKDQRRGAVGRGSEIPGCRGRRSCPRRRPPDERRRGLCRRAPLRHGVAAINPATLGGQIVRARSVGGVRRRGVGALAVATDALGASRGLKLETAVSP
jgi:hypothetical protein